jgi:hypothetical protein
VGDRAAAFSWQPVAQFVAAASWRSGRGPYPSRSSRFHTGTPGAFTDRTIPIARDIGLTRVGEELNVISVVENFRLLAAIRLSMPVSLNRDNWSSTRMRSETRKPLINHSTREQIAISLWVCLSVNVRSG